MQIPFGRFVDRTVQSFLPDWKFAAHMYNIDYFNTTLCDSVENDVVWMCNDFTHARYAWAALEEVRVFCRMFKVVLYSLN